MITEQTVFILGAGASEPYGYPTGKELRQNICRDFVQRLEDLIGKINDPAIEDEWSGLIYNAKEFVCYFDRSDTPSIDLFLARNRKYAEIGKMAIAFEILTAEQNSRFREAVPDGHDWYSLLQRRMLETLLEEDGYKLYRNNKVSFITFNYDRSLEYFLYDSLVHSFTDIMPASIPVAELIPFQLIHVFGKIAGLRWEKGYHLEYRSDFGHIVLGKAKDNINTIYETANDNEQRIHDLIQGAKRIFFLGFGYHQENLKVLGISEVFNRDRDLEVYGTALGFTKREIKNIDNNLRGANKKMSHDQIIDFKPFFNIEGINSYELLRKYL